jgi:hypothetical protein
MTASQACSARRLLADVGSQMGGCRRSEVGPIVRVDGDDLAAREVRSDLVTDPPEEPVEIIGVLTRLIVVALCIGVSLSSSVLAVARRYVALLSGLVPIGGEHLRFQRGLEHRLGQPVSRPLGPRGPRRRLGPLPPTAGRAVADQSDARAALSVSGTSGGDLQPVRPTRSSSTAKGVISLDLASTSVLPSTFPLATQPAGTSRACRRRVPAPRTAS